MKDGNKRKGKRKAKRDFDVTRDKDSVSITKFVHNDLYEILAALPSKKKMRLENFAIVHTGPSVIPTYLPSLRIWNYNISRPEDKYIPTENALVPENSIKPLLARLQARAWTILERALSTAVLDQLSFALDVDVLTRKKRRRHRKKKKPIVRLPRHFSPLSPSRMNRYLTPLGYTQYYLPIDKHTHPNWTIEYITYPQERLHNALPHHLLDKIAMDKVEAPYQMDDLTIIKWLELAKKLTSSKKKWTAYVKRMYVSSGAERK